jgi:hypothetical protein
MAIKEVATKQIVLYALENQTISTGATTGAIIDTKDYDNGIYFAIIVTDWTAGGATLTLYDGDDSGLSDAAIIPDAQLIYDAPTVDTAATVEGATVAKLGCFGNKRYVRPTVTGDGTANLDVVVVGIVNPEIAATAQGGL